jgi:hypothetical protein
MSESNYTMQVRKQVSSLRSYVAGSLWLNRKTIRENERIRALLKVANEVLKECLRERDEARREVCAWQSGNTGHTLQNTATIRGWDCFKEKP